MACTHPYAGQDLALPPDQPIGLLESIVQLMVEPHVGSFVQSELKDWGVLNWVKVSPTCMSQPSSIGMEP